MTKRLVVCCDGTWNNPQQEDNGLPAPSNVFKIHNAIALPENDKYYHPGVGGEGGIIRSIAGGAVGAGISRHICSAYYWLANNYEEGADIYLYGFSRGAFTARSLGAFLGRGLLNLAGVKPAEAWLRVYRAYEEGYRTERSVKQVNKNWKAFHAGGSTPVRFIGVWDTVGALGVPDDFELLNFFDNPAAWRFHNTDLGDHVQTGRHAMAIDEMRSSFCVTRWTNRHTHNDVSELWFPGVHSDVGGGYASSGLSDGALLWMIKESERAELPFHSFVQTAISPNPLGVLHNSYKGAFAKLRSRPRNLPAMHPTSQEFHESALARQKNSPLEYSAYHPTTILGDDGDSASFNVYANQHWNRSGLYLEAGIEYTFNATGEWRDSEDACDWKGTEDTKLTMGDIIRSFSGFMGAAEPIYSKVTGNNGADFMFTKRIEDKNWFTLIGAITNDNGSVAAVNNDGSPLPHQYVELYQHRRKPLVLKHPGYLYCFPNDVWGLYGNNSGSLRVTVTRVRKAP